MNRFVKGWASAAMLGLACGGSVHAQAVPHGVLQDVRPLLDSRGDIEPPEPGAIPTNPDHHTRAGLYAIEAQARALEASLGRRLITVHVGCCGAPGIDDAVHHIWNAQGANGFPVTVPVLIYGDDMWHAARVVDRLTDQGFSRVFLVRGR